MIVFYMTANKLWFSLSHLANSTGAGGQNSWSGKRGDQGSRTKERPSILHTPTKPLKTIQQTHKQSNASIRPLSRAKQHEKSSATGYSLEKTAFEPGNRCMRVIDHTH